jgi:hypothetical protein
MTAKQIPESNIAISPVIINDTHRQSREHRCPIDEHALVERLKEWELREHIAAAKHHGFTKGREHEAKVEAFHRVIDLIQNGRVRQQHRMLVPEGWSEVDR